MKVIKCFVLSLLLISSVAWADGHTADADKPSITASRTVTVSAEVTAINQETREITIQGPEGETNTFTASVDVRNLAQVVPGDMVFAEYYEEVNISVHANPEGLEPGAGAMEALARSEEGALPGGGIMDTLVITAVVEEINLEANTFKLRGPEGNINEFVARDPENLRKSDVGDLVLITITQAMGIVVEHPTAE